MKTVYDFTLPDYFGKSIINLMSSVSGCFGNHHSYNECSFLGSSDLSSFDTVLLIVIDGLGYNYLMEREGSFLREHCRARLTSTFLSTTACANTAFHAGYPPQQHALTGWDMNLKEVGAVTTILPFIPMYGGPSLSESGFAMDAIMDIPSFHEGFEGTCYTVIDKNIASSPFTRYVAKDTVIIPVRSCADACLKTGEIIGRSGGGRSFIHVYLPWLDSAAHKKGIGSRDVLDIFRDMDGTIAEFARSVIGTNTLIMVTGDHGLIDIEPETVVRLEEVQGLKECLTIPLAGEARVRDCFVRPGKVGDFERIAADSLSEYCWCFEGKRLIEDNLYGLGEANARLKDRVGDYVLVMKGNYILKDRLANYRSRERFVRGQHGGVSDDEMFVPLVLFEG